MGEYFRNAMEYFGKPSLPENDFVGKIVEIHVTNNINAKMRLKVRNLIAEGGTAYIYKVEEIQTGKEYALKRFLGADHEDCIAIRKELNFLKILPFHPNIVKFIGSSGVENGPLEFKSPLEFYLVTELCQGTLYDYINYKQSQSEILSLEVIGKCFLQCVKSVEFLHRQRVAITHRDIKIENFLIGKDLRLKLCDFGSATTDFHYPTVEWNVRQRETLQDQLMKVTTPIYRSPEIIDIWSNFCIGPAIDVWSLGCILYFLCFQRHPFENSSILSITNGKYLIPKDNPTLVSHSQYFQGIIKECLQVNPDKRMDITHLSINFEQLLMQECGLKDLESGIEELKNVNPKEDLLPVISEMYSNNIPPSTSAISGFMSQVKGGAENIFKNIKQNINRHQQHFQQSHHSTNNNQRPLFLTSKIVIIIFPSSSTGTPFFKHFEQNDVDPIRLENLSFYNLSKNNKLIALPPPIRVVEAGSIYNLLNDKCPTLECLQILVDDIFAFLTANSKNVAVLQNDDVKLMGTVLASLLMFSGLIESVDDALQICALKLNVDLNLRSSQLRYLHYLPKIPARTLSVYLEIIMCKFLSSQKNRFNRLFLELFGKNDKIILATEADISPNGELAKFPVAMNLSGDVAIMFYHSNGGSKTKVGQLQFNTAFEMKSKNKTSIFFSCNDLDDTKADFLFDVKITFITDNQEGDNTVESNNSKPFLNNRDPGILFSSQAEQHNMMEIFGPKKKQVLKEVVDETFVSINNKDVILDCISKSEELLKEREYPFGNLVDLSEEESAEPSNDFFCSHTNDTNDRHTELNDIFAFHSNGVNSSSPKKPQKSEFEAAPPICTNDFKMFGITKNEISNENLNPTSIETQKAFDESPKATSNFDDILGDFPIPNAKVNGILKPACVLKTADCPDPKSSSSNVPVNNRPQTQDMNSKPKCNVSNKSSYNSTFFDFATTSSTFKNNTKDMNDIFGDILNEQGYTFTSKTSETPVSINDLYKKDMIAQMDPEEAKLMEWSKGKQNNIRGLLCTLHTVLWSDAKWQKCEMSQIVTPSDVKKIYRKACLAVHPDKHNGTQNEHIAKLIFMELNQAWSNFENDSAQQKLFS